jgi:hypothetical protein
MTEPASVPTGVALGRVDWARRPGPEHERLNAIIGRWINEGHTINSDGTHALHRRFQRRRQDPDRRPRTRRRRRELGPVNACHPEKGRIRVSATALQPPRECCRGVGAWPTSHGSDAARARPAGVIGQFQAPVSTNALSRTIAASH